MCIGKEKERGEKRRREETGRICHLTAASLQRWTLRKADGRPIILVSHVLQTNLNKGFT